jgi:hypothetical protein
MSKTAQEVEYRKQTVTTVKWRRASRFVFDDPVNGDTQIRITEQDVVDVNGDVQQTGAGTLTLTAPPDRVITMYGRNNLPNGKTRTYDDLYDLLRSVYLSEAAARDQRIIDEEAAEAARRAAEAAAAAAEGQPTP